MKLASNIKGVMFDLDGVLHVGSRPINGALKAVEAIREAGLQCRFVTNTSTLSINTILHKINGMGFNLVQSEIISAPQAAFNYLKKQPNPVCKLLLTQDVKRDFLAFPQSETEANYIVVGDIGSAWTYRMINEVFNCLMNGAQLIAMHKNRFWQTEHGLNMDIGAFITGLEYASNTEAMIMGKPSADFYNAVLDDMGLKAAEVLMVGDDIDSDVGGAQAVGMTGVLVRTGKYREAYATASDIQPDFTINSVVDLPDLLGAIR